MELSSSADVDLLAGVQERDEAALRELFARHAAWLTLRLRRRSPSEDLVADALQDTFVAVWKGAGSFRGEGDVGAWLWGIAIRQLLMRMRRPAVPSPLGADMIAAMTPAEVSAEDQLLVAVESGPVGDALRTLSPRTPAGTPGDRHRRSLDSGGGSLARASPRDRQVPGAAGEGTAATTTHLGGGMVTMSGDWHVDTNVWAAYAAGTLDPVAEASLDAHVANCPVCRDGARAYVAAPALEPVWVAISAEIRRPERPWTLRLLRRCGVREDDLTLLGAADGFSLPWAVAVGSALLTVVLAAMVPSRQDLIFLLLGPLVPMLAVAAAFDATDPLRELTTATAYSKLRLMLLRTAATVAVALPATLAIGLGLPGLEPLAFAWLLPALALTVSSLMAMTWLAPWPASATVGGGWAVVVVIANGLGNVAALSSAVTQLATLGLAIAMSVALVLHTTTRGLAGGER